MNEAVRQRPQLYVVRLERGGPWDWARDLGQQDGWDEYADFMDASWTTASSSSGGRWRASGRRCTLLTQDPKRKCGHGSTADPWARNGMLTVKTIERWTILLDGR